MENKKELRLGFYKQDYERHNYSSADIASMEECAFSIKHIADMARDYFLFCEPEESEAIDKAATVLHTIKVLSEPICEFLFEGAPKEQIKEEAKPVMEYTTKEGTYKVYKPEDLQSV